MAPRRFYLKKDGEDARDKILSLIFSICFHIALAVTFVVVAPLFKRHEKVPEIYTVRLFYPEVTPSSAPRSTTQKKVIPRSKHKKKVQQKKITKKKKRIAKKKKTVKKTKKKIVKKKKATSTKKSHKKVSQKKKVISTKPKRPLKRKVKKDEDRLLQERLARIRRRVEEKKEEEYLNKRLQEIKKKARKEDSTSHITSLAKGPRPQGEDAILQRYFARIWEIIRSRWVLPQDIIERKRLEAIVDLTISRDGRILVKHFEKRSHEPLFDQSVERAIEGLESLPPLPKELGVSTLDIGVRFRPED